MSLFHDDYERMINRLTKKEIANMFNFSKKDLRTLSVKELREILIHKHRCLEFIHEECEYDPVKELYREIKFLNSYLYN